MKNEYSLGKRLLSLLLSVVLVLGMVPVNQVSAAENEEPVVDTEETAAFAFKTEAPEAIHYTDGLTYTNEASGGEGNGAITYTITSGTEVATIDAATGTLTILAPGTVTVHAAKAADGEVEEQTDDYTLEILPPEKKGFEFDVKEPEDLPFAEELTYTNAASGGDGEGEVAYALLQMPEKGEPDPENPEETLPLVPEEVEKTDVAEIDPETGKLTILKTGDVTVRATKTEDGETPAQVAEYTLKIVQGEQTDFAFALTEAYFGYSDEKKFENKPEGGESEGEITYAITEGNDPVKIAEIDEKSGKVTTLALGIITVTATKAADDNYKEAKASYTLTIVKSEQTGFGFENPNPESIVFEADKTFSNKADGGKTDGAVTYKIQAGNDVAEIEANTGVLTIKSHGTVTVVATKAGNDKYNDATASYSLVVTKVPQTGFAFENPAPEAMDYEENLTFTNTASGGEGDGAITYSIDAGSDMASVDQNGKLTIKKHGTVTVKATKAADEIYDKIDATYSLTIRGLKQEPLKFKDPNPKMIALKNGYANFSNTVTGGSGTGKVTYAITKGGDIAEIEPTTGWVTINGIGTIKVTATKAADNAYDSTSASYTLVVGESQKDFYFAEKVQEITYAPGTTHRQEPKGGSGFGKVTYSISGDANVAKIDSNTGVLTILKAGEVEVTAVKGNSGSFMSASASYTLKINKAEQTGFDFAQNEVSVTYGENSNQFELVTSGGESSSMNVTYTIQEDPVGAVTLAGNKLTIQRSGEVVIEAVKSGDDCYLDSAPAKLTLTIKKAPQILSFLNDKVVETYGILEYTQTANVLEPCNDQAVIYSIEGENLIGAVIDAATGKLTFGDSEAKVGTITVVATKPEDECYDKKSAQYTFTLEFEKTPDTPYTLSGDSKNDSGWFTGNVTITAPEGYLLSTHNQLTTADDEWSESVVWEAEGHKEDYTIYLKNIETGSITDGILVEGLKIDKTPPRALNIEYKTAAWYEILESIFGFSQKKVEVFFSAEDPDSGIAVMEYSTDGGNSFTVLEKNLDNTYSASIPAQYRDKVVLRATNTAGYVMTTLDSEYFDNNDKTLVVDDTKPVIKAQFSGGYVYDAETDINYTNSKAFAITFDVEDANYDLREANPVVKVNGVERELSWTSSATTGHAVLELKEEGSYTITVDFTDRSGNAADQYQTTVYVDRTVTVRTVNFNDPARIVARSTMKDVETVAEGDDVVAYYNTDAVATILITEENFHARDVVITVNRRPIKVGKWEKDGGNTWKNTVTLTEEGDYILTVEYKDRAQNEMAKYQSHQIVVDKTAPKVSVVYGNKDVKNTFAPRDYFAAEQTATITIQDRNFRADEVQVLVTAKDAAGVELEEGNLANGFAQQAIDREAWTPYVEGTKRSENDQYVLTLVFDADANYTFDVAYTDLAKHQSADYEEDAFTVDKTAPTNLTISYSESKLEEEPTNTAYYNDRVTVTITAEDATSGVHYFNYSYINAENVSAVNAELKDQRIEAVRDGAKGTATFTIPKEELTKLNQFNGTVTIVAADRSEMKSTLKDPKRIVVDNIKPEREVTYSEEIRKEDGIFYYGGQIDGTLKITEANFFAEKVNFTVTKDGEVCDIQPTWKDESVDTHIGTFALTEDGHYVVKVDYTDKSGNEMEPYTSQELVLDKTAPTDLNIEYREYTEEEGDEEKPYTNKFEEKISDLIDKLFQVYYYNTDAKVILTATDVTSGMESIALNVTLSGSDEATDIELPENLVIFSDGKISGSKGAIKDIRVAYEDGKMTVTFRIPAQFRGALDMVAMDMSKNTKTHSDDSDDVIVVVDTIAPGRTVTFTPDRAVTFTPNYSVEMNTMLDVDKDQVKEGDAVVLYFKEEAVATFEIKEANFYEEDVHVFVNGNAVEITDWANEKDDIWRGTLTLKEEGDYVITATYLDRANNTMTPYQSQRIVVDKTAPVITTTYSNSGLQDTIDGRNYYQDQQSVTISIKEHNFRADDVKITVTAVNAAGSDVLASDVAGYAKTGADRNAWTPYTEGTWRNENDTYELTLTFAGDANYTFDVEYEDLATNESAAYTPDAFTVDKTAPTGLSISYSESVLETVLDQISFGFYNAKVTVNISATDETSGVSSFVYSYLNASGVSSVNAQLANQTIAASGSNGSGTATFTIPKDALTNTTQFNGSVNFRAIDRSKNEASLQDSKRIVVDNISPTATITYNKPAKTVGEVTYYADQLQCTIKMNEANFYAEDVKVTATKDETPVDVNVTWTKVSADEHTGVFTFTEDGEYVISIEYTDKSGNKMVSYVSKKHVLDKTHPTIKVSNIKNNSANKDEKYGFVIEIRDINLDVETMEPVLTAVVKDENGIYTVKEIELGDPVAAETGVCYTYTVENLTEDALYKLTCTALDLAGNKTIEMLLEDEERYEEVAFSINRNGSTFAYGNYFTEKLVEQYYVYSVDKDIVIVEVNVDPIENYVVKLNGEELREGADFTTLQTSNEGEWSRRIYYINKDLFEDEGEYNIVITTVDKAETTAFSDVKNLVVAFVVDRTKPVVTITGLETGGRYQTAEQTVTLIPTDEGGRLNSLRVIVYDANGIPLANEYGEDISIRFNMSGEEFLKYLEENDGKVTFTIPEGLNNKVQIICNDCAVNTRNQTNEYNELFEQVTVSQNKLIIFYANKPAFYGTLAGSFGLVLLLIFLLFKRRKDDEDQETE